MQKITSSDLEHFHNACMTADMRLIAQLIKQGIDVNAQFAFKNYHPCLPLSRASEKGLIPVMQMLIDAGADVKAEIYAASLSPLKAAIKNGQTAAVKLLLSAGAQFSQIPNLSSCLTEVCAKGDLELLKLCLANGASLKEVGEKSNLLKDAIIGNKMDIAHFLMANGFSPAEITHDTTALVWAARAGSTDGVRFLLDQGVAVNSNNNFMREYPLHAGCVSGVVSVIECLLQYGANINQLQSLQAGMSSTCNETALMVASKYGRVEVVRYLIEQKAEINLYDDEHFTALIYACKSLPFYKDNAEQRKNKLEIVKILIQQGASVASRTREGKAALQYAVNYGSVDIMKELLLAGAELGDIISETHSLRKAFTDGNLEMVNYLISLGANPTNILDNKSLLDDVIAKGNLSCVSLLFELGLRIDTQEHNPLIQACGTGNVDILRLLIEKGADLHEQFHSILEYTPTLLHVAAREGHLSIVEFLLQQRVDCNIKNNKGHTAIALACNEEKLDIVNALLEAGVNPQQLIEDPQVFLNAVKNGNIPLLAIGKRCGLDIKSLRCSKSSAPFIVVAAQEQQFDMVKYFLENGADVNATGGDGISALYCACQNQQIALVKMLMQYGADTEQIGISKKPIYQELGRGLRQYNGENKIKRKTARTIACKKANRKMLDLVQHRHTDFEQIFALLDVATRARHPDLYAPSVSTDPTNATYTLVCHFHAMPLEVQTLIAGFCWKSPVYCQSEKNYCAPSSKAAARFYRRLAPHFTTVEQLGDCMQVFCDRLKVSSSDLEPIELKPLVLSYCYRNIRSPRFIDTLKNRLGIHLSSSENERLISMLATANEVYGSKPFWRELPKELIVKVLSHLDVKSLVSFGQASKVEGELLKNNLLWKKLFIRDFGLSVVLTNEVDVDFKILYQLMQDYKKSPDAIIKWNFFHQLITTSIQSLHNNTTDFFSECQKIFHPTHKLIPCQVRDLVISEYFHQSLKAYTESISDENWIKILHQLIMSDHAHSIRTIATALGEEKFRQLCLKVNAKGINALTFAAGASSKGAMIGVLLDYIQDVNVDDVRKHPFCIAVAKGHTLGACALARILPAADINALFSSHPELFLYIMKFDDIELMKILITKVERSLFIAPFGKEKENSAVGTAVAMNRAGILKLLGELYEKSELITLFNQRQLGYTLWHRVAKTDNLDCALIMNEYVGNEQEIAALSIADNEGLTPLHWAMYHNLCHTSRWIALLNTSNRKWCLNTANDGRGCLHLAAMNKNANVFLHLLAEPQVQEHLDQLWVATGNCKTPGEIFLQKHPFKELEQFGQRILTFLPADKALAFRQKMAHRFLDFCYVDNLFSRKKLVSYFDSMQLFDREIILSKNSENETLLERIVDEQDIRLYGNIINKLSSEELQLPPHTIPINAAEDQWDTEQPLRDLIEVDQCFFQAIAGSEQALKIFLDYFPQGVKVKQHPLYKKM